MFFFSIVAVRDDVGLPKKHQINKWIHEIATLLFYIQIKKNGWLHMCKRLVFF